MATKIGYTPTSIFAAGCGAIATSAAMTNPATAPFAGGIGTAASAVAGGVELNDKEKNIKDNLNQAMDKAWETIDKKYRLSLHTEKYTDNCLTELKREVMGKNTSVEEFIRNMETKGFEPSVALVIMGILEKHSATLNRDPQIIWSDEYTENAAKEMSSILVAAIKSVFEDVDHLRILKTISESEKRIVTELHQATDQVIGEIRNLKPIPAEAPLSLTDIPSVISLIGREKDTQAIYNLLERHNIVFIHADGGVGKTTAAAKIVNQIKDDITSGKGQYKHVAWITSTGDLKSDLTGLNIPLVDTMKTPEEKYKIVSTYLQSNPTLLVIDNMDEPPTYEDSNKLNTITGQTKVLITSRAYIPYAEEYLLVELDPDSALVLFYRHYTRKEMTIEQIRDRKDYSYGENIVKAATYNALFIELIGKMAYSDHWKLDCLWKKLSEDVFGVDSKHPIFVTHGDDGKLLGHIEKLYEMSGLSERQKEIMSFIALFPVEHSIFFDVFEWAGFEDDEEDNLGALQDRGWIVRDEGGYLIHTMVKGSIEKQVGDGGFDEEKYDNLIGKLADVDQYMPEKMLYSEVRLRIVVPETISVLLIDSGSNKEDVAELFSSMSSLYLRQGKFDKAAEYCQKALGIFENIFGKAHSSTAIIYHNLAKCYLLQKHYEKALDNFEKAINIAEDLWKNGHPNVAAMYADIALVYRAQGNYDKAQDYLSKALAIFQKELGEKHSFTATTYCFIAGLYRELEQNEKALEYYKKAEKIEESVLGTDHPSISILYSDLASLYLDIGQYTMALEYYEKALPIYEKVRGNEHPYILQLYNNIALVYDTVEQYETALEYYKKSLVFYEKTVGLGHPDVAKTYDKMAWEYCKQGQYEKSIEYCEKALLIFKKVFGEEHPDTLNIYSNLAELYNTQRQYKKALKYHNKVLSIRENVLGENHKDTASTYNYIGTVYYSQSNYNDALKYYEKAIVIREKLLGVEDLDTAITYGNMAAVYDAQKQYEKALQYYKKALKVFEVKLGIDHVYTKDIKERLEELKMIST